MKKYLLILVTCLIVILLVGGTSLAAEFVLSLGHGAAEDNPRHTVALEFAKWVNEKTNGMVNVNVFSSESMGSDREMMESVIMGTLDMSINSQGPMTAFDERIGVFGLPFLFNDMEEVETILTGPFGKKLAEEINLGHHGFKIIGFFDNGFRDTTNNVRPIYEPNDLKGLKIRAPEAKMQIAIFQALGAKPAPLPFGELYLALSQGVFDGQENPPVNIYYSRFYEVQKYISLTKHMYEMCPFIVSEATWSKLPSDIQVIIEEGAQKFAKIHREKNTELNEGLLDKLAQEGMEINEVQTEKFVEATAGIYEDFRGTFGGQLIDELLAELKKIRN